MMDPAVQLLAPLFTVDGHLQHEVEGVNTFRFKRLVLFDWVVSLPWRYVWMLSISAYVGVVTVFAILYNIWGSLCGGWFNKRGSTTVVSYYFSIVSLAANGGYLSEPPEMVDSGNACFAGRTVLVGACSFTNILFVAVVAALVVSKVSNRERWSRRVLFSEYCTLQEVEVVHAAPATDDDEEEDDASTSEEEHDGEHASSGSEQGSNTAIPKGDTGDDEEATVVVEDEEEGPVWLLSLRLADLHRQSLSKGTLRLYCVSVEPPTSETTAIATPTTTTTTTTHKVVSSPLLPASPLQRPRRLSMRERSLRSTGGAWKKKKKGKASNHRRDEEHHSPAAADHHHHHHHTKRQQGNNHLSSGHHSNMWLQSQKEEEEVRLHHASPYVIPRVTELTWHCVEERHQQDMVFPFPTALSSAASLSSLHLNSHHHHHHHSSSNDLRLWYPVTIQHVVDATSPLYPYIFARLCPGAAAAAAGVTGAVSCGAFQIVASFDAEDQATAAPIHAKAAYTPLNIVKGFRFSHELVQLDRDTGKVVVNFDAFNTLLRS